MQVSQKKVQTNSAGVDPIRPKKLHLVGINAWMPNDEPMQLSNSLTYQPIKFLPSPVSGSWRIKPAPVKPGQHIGPPDTHTRWSTRMCGLPHRALSEPADTHPKGLDPQSLE
ncbi:Hypothetical predicted protein [Pelobates cultripes]|uniref:Uncharacterized protein n=1 Tax=Pelobates cultripes TaxID=61616 RepID=A0AAD1RL53_PELCU|nr:Hypothetical predicted protein [Pelobates cultripes]